MSCRKRRRWHFRDPKFKHFLGEHAPSLPQVWGAFRALTFLPLRALSRYAAHYWYLTPYEINAQGRKKRLGLEGVGGGGGGGCILKIVITKGGYNFHM